MKPETYTGIFNGKEVVFKRVWANHRFTDEECIALCNGEVIIIDYITKSGRKETVSGKLDKIEYSGKTFIGFKPNFKPFRTTSNSEPHIPKSWCSHNFTLDELEALIRGDSIHIFDAVSSRTGKKFECDLKWDSKNNKFIPNFDNNTHKKSTGYIPNSHDDTINQQNESNIPNNNQVSSKNDTTNVRCVEYSKENDKSWNTAMNDLVDILFNNADITTNLDDITTNLDDIMTNLDALSINKDVKDVSDINKIHIISVSKNKIPTLMIDLIAEDPEIENILDELICLYYSNGTIVIVYESDYNDYIKDHSDIMSIDKVIKDYAIYVGSTNY